MSLLPLCILVIAFAAIVARCFQKQRVVKERAGSMLVTIVFLLYPGIVTRVFTTLKCKQIGAKSYLVADYSVVCWEGEPWFAASTEGDCGWRGAGRVVFSNSIHAVHRGARVHAQ